MNLLRCESGRVAPAIGAVVKTMLKTIAKQSKATQNFLASLPLTIDVDKCLIPITDNPAMLGSIAITMGAGGEVEEESADGS